VTRHALALGAFSELADNGSAPLDHRLLESREALAAVPAAIEQWTPRVLHVGQRPFRCGRSQHCRSQFKAADARAAPLGGSIFSRTVVPVSINVSISDGSSSSRMTAPASSVVFSTYYLGRVGVLDPGIGPECFSDLYRPFMANCLGWEKVAQRGARAVVLPPFDRTPG
jgi:hypothetical protein